MRNRKSTEGPKEPEGDWRGYLQRFHQQQPGITEDLLAHALDRGTTPYEWVVEPVTQGPVLDLACGSGPLAPGLAALGWTGFDLSPAELSEARRRCEGRIALADATALPVADGSAASVVCSMALMVVQPLDRVLSEVARVLRPGGKFVALVPSIRPVTAGDAMRYVHLLAALRRRRFGYPNDRSLEDVAGLARRHGLRLVSDESRRFACRITSPAVGIMCVRSLYLPDLHPDRLAAGERVAEGWVGKELGLPLRRVVAVREPSGPGHGRHRPGGGARRSVFYRFT